MYHKSNLGSFANEVEYYADINGYVPETESDLDALNYDDPGHCLRDDRDYRLAFLEDAQAATERAEAAIAEWRRRNG